MFFIHSVAESEFISRAAFRDRRWTLLTTTAVSTDVMAVPVSGHSLIVPDGGCLCVAEIPWFPSVLRGKEQQGLNREHLQVSLFKMRHVFLPTEGILELVQLKFL